MDERIYWIWMQQALGEGAVTAPVLEYFGSAKALYDKDILEWRFSGLFTSKQIHRMTETKLEDAQDILRICLERGWSVLTYADKAYPPRLRELPDPPCVLYISGRLPEFGSRLGIGIVGPCKVSEYAKKAARGIASASAACGAVIVSGGALGADTQAHLGALSVQGSTVAVLGCGLGADYLKSNAPLRDLVAKNGALVTEYPPGRGASKTTFPRRNRIISGLSDGVVVVEAGERSGSLITANLALEQNRDVFAVSGSILSKACIGTNRLIADGAVPVTSLTSVIRHYGGRSCVDLQALEGLQIYCADPEQDGIPEAQDQYTLEQIDAQVRAPEAARAPEENMSQDLLAVYRVLTSDLQHVDAIVQQSGLPGPAVLSGLTQLELMGLAQSAAGKRYRKD